MSASVFEGRSRGTVLFLSLLAAVAIIACFIFSQKMAEENAKVSPGTIMIMIVLVIGYFAFYLFRPWMAILFLFLVRPIFDQLFFLSEYFLQIYGAAVVAMLALHLVLYPEIFRKPNPFLVCCLALCALLAKLRPSAVIVNNTHKP